MRFIRRAQYSLTNQEGRMKHKIRRIKESHWILHNDKQTTTDVTIEQKNKEAIIEDEFCKNYDSLHKTRDSGLRIVETISIPKMPKNQPMKRKCNTGCRTPIALLNTNRNLCRTNQILLSIVKMIKISLKTNSVETPDKEMKKKLEDKLEQQKQEHLLFAQSMSDILKANGEKERHMQDTINSLRVENEKMKRYMKANQQETVQKADMNNRTYKKQTARKSTIYKDLRYIK